MEMLRTIFLQNEYLINIVGTVGFLFMVVAGGVNNILLSMVIMFLLGCETIKRLDEIGRTQETEDNSLSNLLKWWVVLCFVITIEYFVVLLNISTINVMLNLFKLYMVCFRYPTMGTIYDTRIKAGYDRCYAFYKSIFGDVNGEVGNTYDLLGYFGTFNITKYLNVGWFKKNQ